MGKTHEPSFLERVDGDNSGVVLDGFFQCGEHARVVGAWVLANADDGVGLVDIIKGDGALAYADGLFHGSSTRLVAHV